MLPFFYSNYSIGAAHRTFQLALLFLSYCTIGNALAQTTPITSSGMNTQISDPITTDGRTLYNITGGSRPEGGRNLFHSFGNLDIPDGTTAKFLNDSRLQTDNILGRVTGPNISKIFGTLDTTNFGQANLFLMNPAGFLFGPNAILHVGGSVAFTSANYLRLEDGNIFRAIPNLTDDISLTAAPVDAFGFLGSSPGAIIVRGSHLQVTQGKGISLVGGKIVVESDSPGNGTIQRAQISAPKGQIQLASTASPGEFDVRLEPLSNTKEASFTSFGSLVLKSGSAVNVSGSEMVSIRNGQFVLSVKDAALSTAERASSPNTILLNQESSLISINSSTELGPDIQIVAGTFQMDSKAEIVNETLGLGAGGSILVEAREKIALVDSDINSSSGDGAGSAGSIHLTAPTISLKHANIISLSEGMKNAGDILLAAKQITLEANEAGTGTTISAETLGSGSGGHISIRGLDCPLSRTHDVNISGESTITSGTLGENAAGNINVLVDRIMLTEGSSFKAPTTSSGQAGNITIDASKSVHVSDLSTIESTSTKTGNAGHITIVAPSLNINSGSVFTDTAGTGAGGTIDIAVHSFTIQNSGTISAKTIGTAASATGGSIIINATDQVTLTTGASITASSTGSADAGNIFINAGQQLDVLDSPNAITTQAARASGGNIDIRAIDRIRFVNSSMSTSVLSADGSGGNIFIDPKVVILEGSNVTAKAVGGPGGNITFVTPLFLADSASTVNASSERGPSGTVNIQSPIANLIGTVGQLASKTSPPQVLLQNRCVALAGGEQSTFILAGRNTLPVEPGGWLSSPVSMEHWTGVSPEHASTLMVQSPSRRLKTWPAMITPKGEANVLSLRRLTPPGFLVRAFATPSTGCPS